MKEYKKFKDCKVKDILYCIEISNIDCIFRQLEITSFDPWFDKTDKVYIHFDSSSLVYDMNKNDSSWGNIIFTTKEEALESAYRQIIQKIKYFTEMINQFSGVLDNLKDIEFKRYRI